MVARLERISAITGNTFREAIRMRLFLLLLVSGVVSLAGGLYFQEFNLGTSELRFITDFGFGAMTLFGSIVTVVATVQLVFGEIEQKTILPILSKPISRVEFLAGKLLGAWLTICSFIGILGVSLLLALWIRESQIVAQLGEPLAATDAVDYGGVVVFALLQCLRLMMLASLTSFFSSYASSSIFAIFMGFLVWAVGQLRGVLIEQWGSGAAQSVAKAIALLLPDFRAFDQGGLAFGTTQFVAMDLFGLGLYALAYACLYGALAALVLKKREF